MQIQMKYLSILPKQLLTMMGWFLLSWGVIDLMQEAMSFHSFCQLLVDKDLALLIFFEGMILMNHEFDTSLSWLSFSLLGFIFLGMNILLLHGIG